MKTAYPFNPHKYHGYAHRRTVGYDKTLSASANEEITKANVKPEDITDIFSGIFTDAKISSKVLHIIP